MQGQGLRDRASEFAELGAVIIGASFDSVEEQKKFAEDNDIYVKPLNAVMTSAGTLYPNIKKTIERVFQTKVFNYVNY